MRKTKKLGTRISVVFVIFSIILGIFISVFTYVMSRRIATEFYSEKGEELSALAAGYVDGDRIGSYLDTMETDEYYDELFATFCELKEIMGPQYLYIFEAHDDYMVFILEAQLETDDPELISPMGTVYDYTDLEYTYLVPSMENGTPSEGVILGSDEVFYGAAVSTWHPVMNSAGELVAFVEADYSLDGVMASIRANLITMLAVYIVAIIVMITLLSILMRTMVSIPLTKLTNRTLSFAAGGKLTTFENDIKTGDEMQTLSEAFGKMAEDIDSYTKTQASVVADRERISTELEVASSMQMSMLPKELPDFPSRHTFDIRGYIRPSQDMGGDFYDYFILEDRWVCAVICDVEAEGMTAAMLLVVAKTIIKSQLQTGEQLDEAMAAVNKQVFGFTDGKVPINAFVGVLDTVDGTFDYINAGYNAPLILRQGGRYEWLTSPAYAPLGMSENVSYMELHLRMHQGDRLVLYSNGLLDAKNPNGETFGGERVRKVLNASRTREYSLEALIRNLYSEMEVFQDGVLQTSDVTMLALEYLKGDREKAQLIVELKMDRAGEVIAFIKEQMKENGMTGRSFAQVAVAAEELFSICCRRAAASTNVVVRCEVPPNTRQVILSFTADMAGRDPLSDESDVSAANAVAFIRRTADSLTFEHRDAEDVLTMTKTATE